MIRYRFNVYDALRRAGHTVYTMRKADISTGAINKLRSDDTSISLKTLDKVCELLQMQPGDVIAWVPNDGIGE